MRMRLEFSVLRGTWEGNDVANVLHSGDEEDETLKTKTEASVWT